MCSLGADPYFTIECEGEKVRSHTVNNNLNPEWDASATFYRKNPHSDILIEVRMSQIYVSILMRPGITKLRKILDLSKIEASQLKLCTSFLCWKVKAIEKGVDYCQDATSKVLYMYFLFLTISLKLNPILIIHRS